MNMTNCSSKKKIHVNKLFRIPVTVIRLFTTTLINQRSDQTDGVKYVKIQNFLNNASYNKIRAPWFGSVLKLEHRHIYSQSTVKINDFKA